MFASKIVCVFVCVRLQCNVLCFTSSSSPPCAPPYLSPMEMRWGQGIRGEEHREAALHNLKGILMNQHSRAAYSHDNRPQTNSCIWSPLVLWLWKCSVCVHVVVFVFLGYSNLYVCACSQMSSSVYLHISSKKLAWELIDFNVCTRGCNYCLLWPEIDFFKFVITRLILLLFLSPINTCEEMQCLLHMYEGTIE